MVRYPEIRVTSASSNPLAVVAAVRHALRRAGVPRTEIATFSREALAGNDPLRMIQVCRDWVGSAGPEPRPHER